MELTAMTNKQEWPKKYKLPNGYYFKQAYNYCPLILWHEKDDEGPLRDFSKHNKTGWVCLSGENGDNRELEKFVDSMNAAEKQLHRLEDKISTREKFDIFNPDKKQRCMSEVRDAIHELLYSSLEHKEGYAHAAKQVRRIIEAGNRLRIFMESIDHDKLPTCDQLWEGRYGKVDR